MTINETRVGEHADGLRLTPEAIRRIDALNRTGNTGAYWGISE